MAEGFQLSKVLSRKFVILYKLCEDLLSKSQHYDWKLRAIKTTLYVAGGMRRASPEMSEDKVRSPLSIPVVSMLMHRQVHCLRPACCEALCSACSHRIALVMCRSCCVRCATSTWAS